ncbi:MAG TPA: peptidoglycan DD-metalloendopeptidase family protein [Acidimicrobiales bacterium]
MSTSCRTVGAAVIAVVILAVGVPPASASSTSPVHYNEPVDAPVVDPWRPPSTEWGAGNRGLDYGTLPGAPVAAAADGIVTFAGQVGGSRHVVVLHADGIRTSYSFLADTDVVRGQEVVAGQRVGTTVGWLHFGARLDDAYIDPSLLLGGDPSVAVRLVPDSTQTMGTVAQERRGVLDGLVGLVGRGLRGAAHTWDAVTDARSWLIARGGQAAAVISGFAVQIAIEASLQIVAQARDVMADLRLLAFYANEISTYLFAVKLVADIRRLLDQPCTDEGPSAAGPSPDDGGRRIAVLVGGVGASGASAAILGVDTGALGYGEDVVLFSYSGGAVPGVGGLGLAGSDYVADDTTQHLETSAAHLNALLEEIGGRHPDAEVDVIAHSQGGIVARLALGDGSDPDLAPVRTLVTFATPHEGSDWATMGDGLSRSVIGGGALMVADLVGLPIGPSMQQISEVSGTVERLGELGPPPVAWATSIVAAGDLVVSAPHAAMPGGHHAVVELAGPSAHAGVITSSAGRDELELALAHQPPLCRSVVEAIRLSLTGSLIEVTTDGLGLAANLGTRWIERGLSPPPTRTPGPALGSGGH